MRCWCGAEGSDAALFDPMGLELTCGGTGTLHCWCGGDLCVCHYHGEIDCDGCEDCRDFDDCDFDDFHDAGDNGVEPSASPARMKGTTTT